jgi:hypothetical protein
MILRLVFQQQLDMRRDIPRSSAFWLPRLNTYERLITFCLVLLQSKWKFNKAYKLRLQHNSAEQLYDAEE